MATFSPLSCVIDMGTGGAYQGTVAQMAGIPAEALPTMSFSHEYIHFLQLISSYYGFALTCRTINLGIYAALVLSGTATKNQVVEGRHDVLSLLEGLADGAAAADADVQAVRRTDLDELKALLLPTTYHYAGGKHEWEIDELTVVCGTYSEPMVGFVTPGGLFRPFTPGLLSESMARRIDQWVKGNLGFAGHSWGGGPDQDQIYNGVRNVLLHHRYDNHVTEHTVDRLTVIISCLALATPRPDHAVYFMLERLASPAATGLLAEAIEQELRAVLRGRGLLSADAFNRLLDDFQHGQANIITRAQYIPLYEHLKRVHQATNRVFGDLAWMADPGFNWVKLRQLMETYSVPRVRAQDGEVNAIDGVATTTVISDWLSQIWRVLG